MKTFVIVAALVCLVASVSLVVASLYVDLKIDRKKFLTLIGIAAVIICAGMADTFGIKRGKLFDFLYGSACSINGDNLNSQSVSNFAFYADLCHKALKCKDDVVCPKESK